MGEGSVADPAGLSTLGGLRGYARHIPLTVLRGFMRLVHQRYRRLVSLATVSPSM